MLRKRLSLGIAVLIMLSAVSCGEKKSDVSNTTENETIIEMNSETNETSPMETLPSANYEGYEFRILSIDFHWQDYDYCVAEEMTGEVVNDAIYYRTEKVKETLNINVTEQRKNDGQTYPELRGVTSAGEDVYDIAFVDVSNANVLATEKLLIDMGNISSIDLDKPWWSQDYNNYINLTDETYVAFGDIDLNYVGSYFVVAFNTDLVNQYQFDEPYELYETGKWTLDKMYEMMDTVSTDVDGNGMFNDYDTDIFGAVGHCNQLRHLVMGSGVSLAKKDNDSYLMDISEKYIKMYDKVLRICSHPSAYFEGVQKCYNDYWPIFNSGRALFHCNTTAAFKNARDADVAYGLLPFPKGDETQNDYYSIIYNGAGGMVVPITVSEPERTGTIIEWMNAFSYGVLKDAFIQSTLYTKYAQDERSVSILKKMYDGTTYCDIAFLYNWGNISYLIENSHCSLNENIVSTLTEIGNIFVEDVAATLGE